MRAPIWSNTTCVRREYMMLPPSCQHDPVYSGAINLERKHNWICRRCTQVGWSSHYDIKRVNLDEFHRLRVLGGWGAPGETVPPAPRVPVIQPVVLRRFKVLTVLFGSMSLGSLCSALPWLPETLQASIPLALVGSGAALLVATFWFVLWKRG